MDDKTLTVAPDSSDAAGADAQGPALVTLLRAETLVEPAAPFRLQAIETLRIGRSPGGGWSSALAVPDARISKAHAQISQEDNAFILKDLGSKNGTWLNGCRIEEARLKESDIIELGGTFFLFTLGSSAVHRVPGAPRLATYADALAQKYAGVRTVAATEVPVLLLAETGAGKDVCARAIHDLSQRRGDFVAVNCGALPRELLEAELFGARRGAYTGLTEDRPGLMRAADGGTLFLDEIGDLPLSAQVALLRVLEAKEVMPLGSTKAVPIDLRVVAATHRDLNEMVAAGSFREDLLARLDGFQVRLPPLRERRVDFGLLLHAVACAQFGPDALQSLRVSAAAARHIFAYDWPHNIRSMVKCLETAAALAQGSAIQVEHLPEALRQASLHPAEIVLSAEDQVLKEELVQKLRLHRGNVSSVARDFGKARTQVHRWIRRFALNPSTYRN